MDAGRLSLRLFIEGKEIPVIGASVSFAPGAPATAEIQVIATNRLWEIEPRAFVSLYYFNSGDEGRGAVTSGEGSGSFRYGESSSASWSGPNDPRNWKLLFMGTMIGIGFAKSASQRQGVLTCADPTELLDCIKQHGTNYKRGGLAQIENAFLGVNMREQSSNTATARDLTGNIENWFTSSTVNGDMNLAAGIQRTVRELFFAGNLWYGRQFNRLRICDIIANLDGDLSSSNLVRLNKFKTFLKERIGEQQGLISARQMIDLLCAPILYTYCTIPCPKFDPDGAHIGLHSTQANSGSLADTLGTMVNEYADWKNAGLNYVIFKPDSQFFPPPTCNMIFPHMYESFSYSRQFTREPTRSLLRTEDLLQPRSYTTTGTATTAEGRTIHPGTRRTVLPRRLSDRLYAPDFDSFSALMDRGSTGGYLARLHTVELPHEFYVGPTIYWGNDGVMGRYTSKQARRAYLSFFSDYLFWRVRFGARHGNLRLKFSPNLVPGHSTVIFDRGSKHFVAYISGLTHTINQMGGTTQLTLTAVREHDEDIDFDRQNRSLEDIVFGDLDPDGEGSKPSFFDPRYSVGNIGGSVYEPLLGTGSIVDLHAELQGEYGTLTGDIFEARTVANSVDLMFMEYSSAVNIGANLSDWTANYTHRPKANLVDILGFNAGDTSWMGFPDVSTDMPSGLYQDLQQNSADGFVRPVAGFMEHAIDMGKAANLKYDSKNNRTAYRTVNERVWKPAVESFAPLIDDPEELCVAPEGEWVMEPTPQAYTISAGDEDISYEIDVEVQARQSQVDAYLNSLKYRGLKG